MQIHSGYFASISVRQHRFQVIKIEFLSIWKNFDPQSDVVVKEEILFRVENHVFVAKSLKASEGCTNSSGKFP